MLNSKNLADLEKQILSKYDIDATTWHKIRAVLAQDIYDETCRRAEKFIASGGPLSGAHFNALYYLVEELTKEYK